MAFCTNCGADVTGRSFCVQCGKMVSGEAAGAAAPTPAAPATPPSAYASAPPQPAYAAAPQPGLAPAKKTSPLLWIVLGIVGFFVIIGLVIMVAVGLFVHKVKQNPALAMAKLLTAANPNVEVVSSDSGNNTVTFRDKQTGETVTMNFDDIKKGKIMFRGKDGQEATIQAHGEGTTGSVEINTSEGSMKFGAGSAAKLPAWVPVYPGTTPEGTFSMQGKEGEGGTFKFTSKDSADAVLAFYQQKLKDAGFKITGNFNAQGAGATGAMLAGEDTATKRTCTVMVGTEGGATSGTIIFSTKP